MIPSVFILSFNSAETLPATIETARSLSDDVLVVDSYSTDDTVQLAKSMGVAVVQHRFESYGVQRNWAMDSLPTRHAWQLHLDADELMGQALIQAIKSVPEDTPHNGFLVPRYLRFLGRVLKHGAMSPTWHLRLFRRDSGRCEDRRYDQHFYLKTGTVGRLTGCLIDDVRMPLSEWTIRHNRWSDAEVAELTAPAAVQRIQAKLTGNPIEQKRFWRARYQKLPLFVRPLGLFLYRYFVRLGFLDGREGLIFWFLQSFWFRFLIDAKLFEYARRQEPARILQTRL
jgi:glycosyltransferase involved in cell wall biosynthesis